jgi:DNA-binding NarL/FixJ family response regulator
MTTHPDPHCDATIHATVRAYQRHGCRCDAITAHMRLLWARHDARRHHPDDYIAVDDTAVTLVADDGHKVPLTTAERKAVVATLTKRGWQPHQIADRLGVSRRTVHRHKAA